MELAVALLIPKTFRGYMSEKSPWLSIWCQPRSTIRKIVQVNPNRALWVLAFIYGFLSFLNSFQSISIGNMVMMPSLIIALVLSPFWGYAAFSVWSWVICRVGRWLKGEGNFVNVRAAFAWSCVPLAVNIALWFVMVAAFGIPILFHPGDIYPINNQQVAFLFLILIGKVAVAIWSLVIYLNALAEVQNFSILRAIFNVLLAWLVIGVILGCIWFVLTYIFLLGSDSAKLTLQIGQSGITLEYLKAIL